MNRMALILAADDGAQMQSGIPKALHTLCGRTMIEHVAHAMHSVCGDVAYVLGESSEAVLRRVGQDALHVAQPAQDGWGTARAVRAAMPLIAGREGCVIIAPGDVPLVSEESLERLVSAVEEGDSPAALLYASLDEPAGYNRIVRDELGQVQYVARHDQLTQAQSRIRACNASIYCVRIDMLMWALPLVKPSESDGLYHLSDLVGILSGAGYRVQGVKMRDPLECIDVDDCEQLARASKAMRARTNRRLMRAGVTMIDPDATYVESDVQVGAGTRIYPGCVLEAGTVVGRNCKLLPHCRLHGAKIGDRVTIENSVVLEAEVADDTTVGPFAYLRPGTRVGSGCRVGDFVELKNSSIGDGTKVSHLTYVGDSDLGRDINLGCGVVFVNYDGKVKRRSTVEDHAFIGCNVNLVAPVHVGKDAYIAAGSTVTRDVPDGALCVARERETVKEGWVQARKEQGKL